ncbi:hypothetical protein [Gemella sanguinis]|uniref:hypothetical protein n=1 Tax=Gemella sanguinis TaxID=84135 RepID=UPI00080763A3|nr:hypothetical protein [Gemella sanguinis]
MNKLQKTLTVALTALALTVTSQAPFAAAAEVNSGKATTNQKASGDKLVDPITLVVSYELENGKEIAPQQRIKVPRPDLSTPLSYFKDYLPEVKQEINYNGKTYQLIKEDGISIQASIHPMEAYMRYYYAEKKPVVKAEKPLRVPAGNNGAKIRVPVAKKQQPKQEVKKYRLPAGNNGVKTRKPVVKKQQPQQPEVIKDVDYL